jgi:hypothetical protein
MSSENNIYIMRDKWDREVMYTDIMKLSACSTNANIQYAGSKKVPGVLVSVSEDDGNLHIVTAGERRNFLFIFDKNDFSLLQ